MPNLEDWKDKMEGYAIMVKLTSHIIRRQSSELSANGEPSILIMDSCKSDIILCFGYSAN